ncbi:MAG: hypothetical protein EZS28_023442 [Streblomastix strix]|uniref:Uncharacterized protein n=1 Tax=Streblomastix strix TaxID=222440 RepID=A0A5J4VES8_9EUKA|nr:MAG: hypothetical protein EZS28_023442 [Streblomastix strix]
MSSTSFDQLIIWDSSVNSKVNQETAILGIGDSRCYFDPYISLLQELVRLSYEVHEVANIEYACLDMSLEDRSENPVSLRE